MAGNRNRVVFAVALILGGLLLANSDKIGELAQRGGELFRLPISTKGVEGTTLYFVHEKTNPPISEVLLVRSAPDHVEAAKLAGFRDVDKDEPFAKAIIEAAAKKNVQPPFIAYGKSPSELVKIVTPWPSKL